MFYIFGKLLIYCKMKMLLKRISKYMPLMNVLDVLYFWKAINLL